MIDSSLAVLATVGLVATAFIFVAIWPKRRLKEESDATLLYEERCPGRKKFAGIFLAGGNIPNYRLSLYERFFVIAALRTQVMSYDKVKLVEYRRQIVSKGIRIQVDEPSVDVVLFPRSPEKVLAVFNAKVPGVRKQA